MKKILITAVVAFATAFATHAQESYSPEQGDFSVEIQVNPFSNNFTTFKLDALQGRYFFNSGNAFRFGIGFGIDSKKDNGNPKDEDLWTKTTNSNFSINFGYEKHFLNYKRIDLYAGAGLDFKLNRSKETQNFGDDRKTVTSNVGDSYNEFAAKAFTGIDFYIYKGIYVGAEFGIKIGVKHFPGQIVKGGYHNGSWQSGWDNEFEVSEAPSSSSFLLATYAEPSLRLGWRF
ncbi:MAG: outer membrane beta-barrel protein [Muribaculaceae bacterium]|nr:outer membrane beta-barrel protein [Muribaculaceae bacterium]